MQAKVKENDFCIAILFYLSFRQVELVHDSLYIPVMNERREFNGEIPFVLHLVIEFRLSHITDVVFAYLLLGILQEMFLFLSSHFAVRYVKTPLFESFERFVFFFFFFQNSNGISVSKERYEIMQFLLILFGFIRLFEGC